MPKPTLKELQPDGGAADDAALMRGWLLKESDLLKNWNRRWCVLLPEALHVFRSDAPHAVCSSVIPLRGATPRVLGSDFHFEIATPRRVSLPRRPRAARRRHAAAA